MATLDDFGTGRIGEGIELGRRRILEHLIETDPLVRAVVSGETTYVAEIQFIHTTRGRRANIHRAMKLYIAGGIGSALSLIAVEHFATFDSSSHPYELFIGTAVALPVIFNALGIFNENQWARKSLTALQEAAKRADEFIQEYKPQEQSKQ